MGTTTLFGFFPMRTMTMGETPVLMERFDFERDVEVEERLLSYGILDLGKFVSLRKMTKNNIKKPINNFSDEFPTLTPSQELVKSSWHSTFLPSRLLAGFD